MDSRKAAILLTLAVAVELSGLWYLATDRSDDRIVSAAESSPARNADDARDGVPSAPRTDDRAFVSVTPASETSIEREALTIVATEGRIVGPRGQPIADATLSWTPLLDWMFDQEYGADTTRTDAVAANTVWTATDRDGRFRFADMTPKSSDQQSVLWITHPDYAAVSLVLAGDRRTWPTLAAITMSPAQGLEVRVEDQHAGVVGATVEQVGFVSPADATLSTPTIDVFARRALRRVATTGRDGWTRLVPVAAPVVLRAQFGNRVSDAKIAPPSSDGVERVTLTLRSTFLVSGRVFGLEEVTEPGLHARIVCQSQRGNVLRTLETIDVGKNAQFGPVAVPVVDDGDVRFVLQGGPLIPKVFLVPAPKAGSTLKIDFTAEVGHDVWFKIVDQEEQSLQQAEALVHWSTDGIELDARARPRPDGFTVVRGIPPGTVVCEARAKGFHSTKLEAETLPELEPSTRGVMLTPAGRISGKCMHAGEAVRDFEITVWPANSSANFIRHVFTDREDGTFALDDAPLGTACVLAAALDYAPAQVARVEVNPEGAHELAFDLTDSVRGRGKVVDHASGASLSDARVQLFTSDGYDVIASLGPARQVSADGTFEMDGFAAGRMICAVSAPGHATTRIAAQGVRNEAIELGVIALVPKQPLEIHLAVEPGLDASEFAVSLTGAEMIPPTAFSAQGLVRIEALSPGSYEMHVLHGGDLVFGSYPMLDAGNEARATWRIDVPLSSPHSVAIDLIGDEERVRAGGLGVVVSFHGPSGEQMERYSTVSQNGHAQCDSVLVGDISVGVFDAAREVLTTLHEHMDADQRELHVIVPLSKEQEVFRVRVIDREGAGIPSVRVQLARDGRGAAWSEETTGEDGVCAFRGIEAGRYLAHLFHQSRGRRVGVPVELFAGATDATVLELAADARVEALFVDGEIPEAGISATLYDAEKSIAFAVIRSNESGVARADGLAEAEYVLEVDDPDFFPISVPVKSKHEASAARIDIRRRGDLELELHAPTGKPLGGIRVELVALETATDVAVWCEQGLVQAAVNGLVTDARGMLRINGLPHGAYRWRASASKVVSEGVVTVPAGNVGRAVIVLP